ncbi:MAG TPA: hypothetical protein VGO96_12570 [Pyrinomonadaceae bacterium]|nr:hypothetical protein [Pyrinomonadaceae bacterium]
MVCASAAQATNWELVVCAAEVYLPVPRVAPERRQPAAKQA